MIFGGLFTVLLMDNYFFWFFISGAVAYDAMSHRLPNYYLLLGLLLGAVLQVWTGGWVGLISAAGGFAVGFLVFLPLYVLGGMAAGDVKLMAVVGSFIGGGAALWAAACSLICGSLLAFIYLFAKGGVVAFLRRYWAMLSLRCYIPAGGDDDPARHRFPYALAIAVGTVVSLFFESPFSRALAYLDSLV